MSTAVLPAMRLVGVLITSCQYPLNDDGLQESMWSTFLYLMVAKAIHAPIHPEIDHVAMKRLYVV